MPCGQIEPSQSEMRLIEMHSRKMSEVTALLCYACKVMREHDLMSAELTTWYKHHDEEDETRNLSVMEWLKSFPDQEEMYEALVAAGLDITEEGVLTLFAMIE